MTLSPTGEAVEKCKHDWFGMGIFTFCIKCGTTLLSTIRKNNG